MPDAARPQGPAPRAARSRQRGREAALARRRGRVRDRVGEGPAGQPRRLRGARSPLAGRTTPAPAGRGRRRSTADYEREKRKRGLVDFDDLITAAPTRSSATPSSPPRSAGGSATSSSTSSRTRAAAQFRLLRAWLGDRADLCVVGDPDQAIYGFAGADRVVPRAVPPRSSRGALPRGRGRAAREQLPLDAPGRRRRERGARSARPSAPQRARGTARRSRCPSSPRTPPPTPKRAASPGRCAARERAQRPVVAHGGALPRRTRSRRSFEEAFDARRHPVPRPRRRAVPRPARGAGRARRAAQSRRATAPSRTFAEHLTDLAARHRRRAARRGAPRARRRAGAARPRVPRGRRRARGSVDGFLEFLQTSLRGDDAGDSADDAVELLTFHRAKGLEFDTVFVTGLERGLVPISHAKSTEALDEEQRLLYVALSRAERGLHLSWARERTVGGRVAQPHARAPGSNGSKTRCTLPRPVPNPRRRRTRQHRRRARSGRAREGWQHAHEEPARRLRVRRAALRGAGRLAAAPVARRERAGVRRSSPTPRSPPSRRHDPAPRPHSSTSPASAR